jgi:hypothetical protein
MLAAPEAAHRGLLGVGQQRGLAGPQLHLAAALNQQISLAGQEEGKIVLRPDELAGEPHIGRRKARLVKGELRQLAHGDLGIERQV